MPLMIPFPLSHSYDNRNMATKTSGHLPIPTVMTVAPDAFSVKASDQVLFGLSELKQQENMRVA